MLAACGTDLRAVNARPEKYYQKTLHVRARVARLQRLPGEVLIELADARGNRILVRAPEPFEYERGDWVRTSGILVPEARVGGATVYDVIMAEEFSRSSAPRFENLM